VVKLKYDLHIHSCLSPCGDDEMTPANAAGMAMLAGLQVVALSDHNTARNCPAFLRAAEQLGLLAVPAMELTTAEEAHVLCLLPTLEAALELDRYVYARLPAIRNKPEIFGNQYIMDEEDQVLDEEERLLITATSIGVYDAAGLLRELGGIAIPAHIDRSSFSVLSNLGFVARDMGFEAVEITRSADKAALAAEHAELRGVPYLTDSDAHRLDALPDAEFQLEVTEQTPAGVIEAIRLGAGLQRL
jgi:PHP family Zn ribbon phosphoesterase